MNKKQKKMLLRIIIAAVLIVVFSLLPAEGYLRFVLFMIPYLVIGYDILKKAFKGILNKQVFDENFLMAVATVGAILLGDYSLVVRIFSRPVILIHPLITSSPAFASRGRLSPVSALVSI